MPGAEAAASAVGPAKPTVRNAHRLARFFFLQPIFGILLLFTWCSAADGYLQSDPCRI